MIQGRIQDLDLVEGQVERRRRDSRGAAGADTMGMGMGYNGGVSLSPLMEVSAWEGAVPSPHLPSSEYFFLFFGSLIAHFGALWGPF